MVEMQSTVEQRTFMFDKYLQYGRDCQRVIAEFSLHFPDRASPERKTIYNNLKISSTWNKLL